MADPQTINPGEDDPLAIALQNLEAQDEAVERGEPSPITAYERPPEAQGGGDVPQEEWSSFTSGLVGAADAASFGFLDEISGAANTVIGKGETVWNSSRDYSAILAGNIARSRTRMDEAYYQHHAAGIVGEVVGSLILPFGSGARGSLQVAKVGAVQGALSGAGAGDGLGDRTEKAVEGGIIGAGVGALLGKFLPGLKAGKTEKAAEGAIGEAAPAADTLAPTAAGPDGTAYATRLEDGSELRGFGQDGAPVYGEAPVVLDNPDSLTPPDQGFNSLWSTPPEELERLAREAPGEMEIPDEGYVYKEAAQAILREHQPYQDFSDDNLVDVLRRTIIEQRSPDWMRRVQEGRTPTLEEQAAMVRMQGALGALKERGYDFAQLPDKLSKNLVDQGWSPHDAAEVLSARLGDLKPKKALPDGTHAVTLEAPPRTPDGTPTPVGTIGRTELSALQQDVADFRESMAYGGDRQADITRAGTPEAAARVGEFRLGNLGDNLDTANLLSALARQLPASGRKTDLELTETASAAAKSIGEDPEAMLAWARQAAGSLGDVDNTMMALRTVWAKAGSQVNELHMAGVDWAQVDDTVVLQAGQAIRNLAELSQQVQVAKVGLGRGLRVNQLPDAETYMKQLLARGEGEAGTATDKVPAGVKPVAPRELPPLPRNRKELADWFELWGMTKGDPKAQADFLQGTLTVPTPGKYLRTSVANLFTASILSAPRTVAMNIVGPSFISLVRNAERFGGAVAGAINPLASAEERAAMREVARQTPTAYFRTLGDIGEAFRYGRMAAEKNQSVIGGGSSTTDAISSFGPLTLNLLGATGTDPSMMYSLGNLINVFPKAFARLNNGLDETAKRLAYMGEVRVRAQVEAAQKGLEGDAFREFVRGKLKGSFDEVGHAQDEQLLRNAERTTFTAQVGEEGSFARRFGNGMQAMRRDIPETRFLFPVFNVPANALGQTLRRIPFANRMFSDHAAELAGERGVVAQAEAHGRTMLGGSFLLAGVMMNRMGLLTGAGPQEATDRRVWLQTHQPYSIRVGDTWVRYDKFDLLGGLLSIPATITDASTYRAADEGIGDMMLAGTGALAQWFKDRAALRTASELLGAGDSPASSLGDILPRLLDQTASGFIPAAIRSVGVDTQDPYVRLRRSWTDYMKASIPGLSQTLEPARNVLGEPIQRSADTWGEAVFPVTMQSAVSFRDDPEMDELSRIYETTGYGAGADPKSLGYGYFNPKDVKLEDGRSIYDRAMQKRMVMKVDGRDLRASLSALFNSDAYNKAVDADPAQRVTSLGDASRGYMVKQVFDRFNKAAKSELAWESPLADKYLTAGAAKQRDDAYLRDLSVEDLVKTPRLYQDRGINPGAYSEKIRGAQGGGDPLAQALGL